MLLFRIYDAKFQTANNFGRHGIKWSLSLSPVTEVRHFAPSNKFHWGWISYTYISILPRRCHLCYSNPTKNKSVIAELGELPHLHSTPTQTSPGLPLWLQTFYTKVKNISLPYFSVTICSLPSTLKHNWEKEKDVWAKLLTYFQLQV